MTRVLPTSPLAAFLDQQEAKKLSVWIKAHPILDQDQSEWRKDDFGKVIRYSEYGNRNSQFGLEIDHIVPIRRGGLDWLPNLRPLHYRMNASLGGLLGAFNR
jgi:hypothetical protein